MNILKCLRPPFVVKCYFRFKNERYVKRSKAKSFALIFGPSMVLLLIVVCVAVHELFTPKVADRRKTGKIVFYNDRRSILFFKGVRSYRY